MMSLRSALAGLVCALLLGACGGAQPGGSSAATMEWLPASLNSVDLLYVANQSTVTVYSYPQGKFIQTLRGDFSSPEGACSDTSGYVWIVNSGANELIGFLHGGQFPERVLIDRGAHPRDCSVDPTTGNLAVTNGANAPGVAIYNKARGRPKIYSDANFKVYLYCSYDDKGNLFVDGQGSSSSTFELAEMAKGSQTLKRVTLNHSIVYTVGLRWDGADLAIGDGTNVDEFEISGTKGKLKGMTPLNDDYQVFQFWIEKHTLIGAEPYAESVRYWPYPKGGQPTKTIMDHLLLPSAATVSLASKLH